MFAKTRSEFDHGDRPIARQPRQNNYITHLKVLVTAAGLVGLVIYREFIIEIGYSFSGDNRYLSSPVKSSSNFPSLVLEKDTKLCDVVSRSTLYSPPCENLGTGIPRRLLITGARRSGTTFLSKLLREVGLSVSHDTYHRKPVDGATDGAVSWPHAFNDKVCPYDNWVFRRSRQLMWEHSHDKRFFLHVVHLVRDPLKAIASGWNLGNIGSFRGISSCNTAMQKEKNPQQNNLSNESFALVQTLQYWVLWNSFIESFAEWRIRSESITGFTIHALYQRASTNPHNDLSHVKPFGPIKSVEEIDSFLSSLGTDVNHGHTKHSKKPLTWDTLMSLDYNYTIMAQIMAQRYGYQTNIAVRDSIPEQVCGFSNEGVWNCYLSP
eukprot:CAMPEP_0172481798 /NCGR_PEP_ID=MMETSP1066-20121228/7902_1 /TAXON_ID=671091 /ORGANISM="Coscinodiscus wailesii, Strain CCMP2513" /LENGTH=378 /DNA_ID=CAMNT_0013244411 /DNA_START=30 /DNA_END=1166 /DNA_ORIENTATION=-